MAETAGKEVVFMILFVIAYSLFEDEHKTSRTYVRTTNVIADLSKHPISLFCVQLYATVNGSYFKTSQTNKNPQKTTMKMYIRA